MAVWTQFSATPVRHYLNCSAAFQSQSLSAKHVNIDLHLVDLGTAGRVHTARAKGCDLQPWARAVCTLPAVPRSTTWDGK